MGAKASALSCYPCKRDKSRYGIRKMNRRRSSSRRRHYNDSYGDAIGGSTVVMRRIESRSRRLGSTRTNRQASLNLANLSTAAHVSQHTRVIKRDSDRLPPSGYRINGGRSCDQTSHPGAIFLENKAARVGDLPEATCPDMSTISLKSGPSRPPSCSNDLRSVQGRSSFLHDDDEVFESQSDVTTNTLAAPPNSINSQFISGVSPLESVQEDEEDVKSSNESVFERPFPQHFYSFHPGYYTNLLPPPPPRILLNNNHLSLSPQWSSRNQQEDWNSPPLMNASDGPGFDSDFGASAGVEMRIVSSDNTGTDSTPLVKMKTSAHKRWSSNKPGHNSRRTTRKKLNDVNNYEINSTSSSVSRLYAYYKPMPDHQRLPQSIPRSRHATVPEASSLHVTMEWDPYDPGYEDYRWMEYIIPGVTYPPPPLLNDEQYWL